jgi:thiol-disulfide isomerase/thioredoxin
LNGDPHDAPPDGPEDGPRRGSARERYQQELDREELERDEQPHDAEEVRRAARPYSMVVGVIFLVVIVIAGINAVSNQGVSIEGLSDWTPLPRFAAPAATGNLDGDANVNQDDTDASGHHRTPACEVPGSARDVIRVPCDYWDKPLVMVAWFTRGCDSCRRQLDTVEQIRGQYPNVHFIGLDIADSLDNARSEVRDNGWSFPMAVDRDGAVSGLYGVGVGPTTFFAYPGGVAMGTAFGELDRQELTTRLRRLLRSSRRLGLLE